jgi:hypothetical protein
MTSLVPKKKKAKMTSLRPGLIPILAFLQDQGFDVQGMYYQAFYNFYLESEDGVPLRTAFPVRKGTQLLDSNDEAVRDAKGINQDRRSNKVAVPNGDRLNVYDLSTLYNKVRQYQDTAVPFQTFVNLANHREIQQQPRGFKSSNRDSDNAAFLHWQKNIETHLSQLLEFIVNGVNRRNKVSRADMEVGNPSNMKDVENIFETLSAELEGRKRQKTSQNTSQNTSQEEPNIKIADRALCKLVAVFDPKCTSKYHLLRIFKDEEALNYIRILYIAYMLDVRLSKSAKEEEERGSSNA